MDIRWSAVFIGFAVDYVLSIVVQLFAGDAGFDPVTRVPATWMALMLAMMTGVGGFVAGRIAGNRHIIHGLLVGAVGILLSALAGGVPREWVLYSVLGWALGAVGGGLSRFVTPR